MKLGVLSFIYSYMQINGGVAVRFITLVLVAGAGATLVQRADLDTAIFSDVSIWIYALLIAFLIDKALIRKNDLRENINIELARLRHIHHISEQLGPKVAKEIDRHLNTYQRTLGEHILGYHQANLEFRSLSHAIYSYTPKTKKETLLYTDLLQTLQDLTLGRQHIQYSLANHLNVYYWFLITLVLFGMLLNIFTPTTNLSISTQYLLTWFTLLICLIPMEMLYKSDTHSLIGVKRYEQAYLKNRPTAMRE
jgi:hypothetical protein